MSLTDEFSELQRLFAQEDILFEPRRPSSGKLIELLLVKRKDMKFKIYQETGHDTPHIHIDYRKQHHVASYSIQSGKRLKGDLPRKYDSCVSSWIGQHREKLLAVWNELQKGADPGPLVAELAGDA